MGFYHRGAIDENAQFCNEYWIHVDVSTDIYEQRVCRTGNHAQVVGMVGERQSGSVPSHRNAGLHAWHFSPGQVLSVVLASGAFTVVFAPITLYLYRNKG